jgi:mutator protein MutT
MNIFGILFKIMTQKSIYFGVPVIIQNSKGEILLGLRSKTMLTYPSTWGLPGGMVDYGERVEETAKREVKEELGVDVKIIKKSSNFYQHTPTKDFKFHTVDVPHYAKIINGTPEPKDETQEIKWFKPSEIKKMNLAYAHKEILKGEGLI